MTQDTSAANQKEQQHAMNEEAFYNKTFKKATRMYSIEKKKKKGGLSARKFMDLVISEIGVSPTSRDIQSYVKDGIIGQYPLKN